MEYQEPTDPVRLAQIAEFEADVWDGIGDGDLEPLARFLEQGFAIDDALRWVLIEHIRGVGRWRFKMELRAKKQGERGATNATAVYGRHLAIGIFFEQYLRHYGRGSHAAAIAEIQSRWGAGKDVANRSLAMVRRHLAGDLSDVPDGVAADLVTLSLAFPTGKKSD